MHLSVASAFPVLLLVTHRESSAHQTNHNDPTHQQLASRDLQATPTAAVSSLAPANSSASVNSTGAPLSAAPASAAPGTGGSPTVASTFPATTPPTSMPSNTTSTTIPPTNSTSIPAPTPSITGPWTLPPSSALQPTLADYIASNEEYGGFATAVLDLGISPILQERLNSSSYVTTAFGPDNVAFSNMDPNITAKFKRPEYSLHFRNLIEYHALDGYYPTSSFPLQSSLNVTMLNNETLRISQDNVTSQYSLFNQYNDSAMASITLPDVEASDGVFQGIDGVLLPDFVFLDIPTKVTTVPSLSNFTEWIVNSGLDIRLLQQEDLTLFAPGNDAFSMAESPFLDYYGDPANVIELRALLLYHVVPKVIPTTLMQEEVVTTLTSGERIGIESDGAGGFTLNDQTRIQYPDVFAYNGIIQIVDHILTPPETAYPTQVPNSGSSPVSPTVPTVTQPSPPSTANGGGFPAPSRVPTSASTPTNNDSPSTDGGTGGNNPGSSNTSNAVESHQLSWSILLLTLIVSFATR